MTIPYGEPPRLTADAATWRAEDALRDKILDAVLDVDLGGHDEPGTYGRLADAVLPIVAAEVTAARERVLAEITAPFASLLAAWQHLRMDTPEDQARHDRLVSLTRRALSAAPGAARNTADATLTAAREQGVAEERARIVGLSASDVYDAMQSIDDRPPMSTAHVVAVLAALRDLIDSKGGTT